MTRFVSQAVGMRARSYKAFDTAAQERRDRRVAQAAGCSPQQLQQHRRRQKQLADLPPPPARGTNPRPFLELAVAGRPVGRLVVELFAQEAGAAAAAFLQRCQAGAASGLSFKGAKVGRVVEGYSVQLDLPRGQPVPGLGNPELQHGTRHTVSLSQEGTEVLVTCGAEPARELDEAGYLVVGRVVEGAEAGGVLHTIEQAPVGADDEPLQAISVSACGLNAQTGPLAGAAAAGAKPQAKTGAELQRESEAKRSAVAEAVGAALRKDKRRREEAGGHQPAAKKTSWDPLGALRGSSSSSSSDNDD